MLHCDVLKEREMQIKLKQKKQAIEREIDRKWEAMELQKMEDYDKRLFRQLETETKKKLVNQ